MASYSDDFNRPDSSTVTGWTEAGDDWSIKSNQLAPGTVATGTIRYDTQLATADHYAEIAIPVVGGTSMGIFARSDAALTNYYLWRNNGTTWTLFANVGGTFTQIGAYAAAAANGDVVRIECRGSTITGYVNGVARAVATDTSITTGTYVGLRSSNSATCRYDSFAAADVGGTVTGTASTTLGALTATATGVRTVRATATTTLGALAAAGTGTRQVNGLATASLGALSAQAAGTRTVLGTAESTFGALRAAAATTPAPRTGQGSWYGLLAIAREAAQQMQADRNAPPVACPNDGEPLRTGPGGGLYCPFDGWRPQGVA